MPVQIPRRLRTKAFGIAGLSVGALAVAAAFNAAQGANPPAAPAGPAPTAIATVPGMPPVIDPHNLYSETTASKIGAALQGDLERVYVPNLRGNDVSVIDPAKLKVVDKIGRAHV